MMLRGRPRTRHFQGGGATGGIPGGLTPQQQMAALGQGMPAPTPVSMGPPPGGASLGALPPGAGMPPGGGIPPGLMGGAPPVMSPGGAGLPPMMPPGMGPGSPPPIPPAATAPMAPGAGALGRLGMPGGMPGRGLNPAMIQQMARMRGMQGAPGGGGMLPQAAAPVIPAAPVPAPPAGNAALMGGIPAMARGGRVRRDDGDADDMPVTKKAKGGVLRRRPPKPPKMKKAVATAPPVPDELDDTAPATAPAAAPPAPPSPVPAMPLRRGGKFIQEAIKKPGALRKSLDVKKGEKIPEKKLASAAHAPGKLGKRARFAEFLDKVRPGKKAKGGACDDKDKMGKGGECKKMAAGGAAKDRRGFPNVIKPPAPKIAAAKGGKRAAEPGSPRTGGDPGKAGARKGIARKGARFIGTFAEGGKVRGCGAAEKGCKFSGIY